VKNLNSFFIPDSEDNSDDSEGEVEEGLEENEDEKKDTSHKESKAYAAMSSLVNYILPVR